MHGRYTVKTSWIKQRLSCFSIVRSARLFIPVVLSSQCTLINTVLYFTDLAKDAKNILQFEGLDVFKIESEIPFEIVNNFDEVALFILSEAQTLFALVCSILTQYFYVPGTCFVPCWSTPPQCGKTILPT
jgi:hypothetical protein